MQTLKLPKPLPLSVIFPPSITTPPAHRDELPHPKDVEVDEAEPAAEETIIPSAHASGTATPTSLAGTNGNGVAKVKKSKGPMVDMLKYVDYRYYRFLLHPEGEFRMVR